MISELLEKSGRSDELHQAMLKVDDDTIQDMINKMRYSHEVNGGTDHEATFDTLQKMSQGT